MDYQSDINFNHLNLYSRSLSDDESTGCFFFPFYVIPSEGSATGASLHSEMDRERDCNRAVAVVATRASRSERWNVAKR